MPSNAPTLPFTVIRRDLSGLFAIEATVVAWRDEPRQPGCVCPVWLTLGPGTLQDADKGVFPLDGLELLVRVADDRIEPIGVLNPGPLSDFQQEALLVLVASAINDAGFRLSPPLRSEA